MRRPTKPQRDFLHRCRGAGILWEDVPPADLKMAWTVESNGWVIYTRENNQFIFRTSKAGEAALHMPAPPPPWGRVGCVNPICGKTEAQEKFPGCDSIICSACFKQVPDLRREYRELWKAYRKAGRAAHRRGDEKTERARFLIGRRIAENWRAIVAAFTTPEKPEGLEQFLKEVGLDADATEET